MSARTAPAAERFILATGRDVAAGDPQELEKLRALQVALDAAYRTAVDGLRASGFTDGDIGAELGCSRVTVIRRWPALEPRPVGAGAWRR
jgi:DNA-directed RNA polymerase specialized sigma24 family protein